MVLNGHHHEHHHSLSMLDKMLLQSGGSLGMWQSYFGVDDLTYVGVDVDVYSR